MRWGERDDSVCEARVGEEGRNEGKVRRLAFEGDMGWCSETPRD